MTLFNDPTDPFNFAALEDDFSQVPTKKTDPKFARTKFTCESCRGTGRWSGGTNRHGNAKCNTCHGNGFLVSSPEARAKKRASVQKAKANKLEIAREQNAEHGNGFLLKWLSGMIEWNSFAASLIDQHNAGRAWSDKQVEACRRMYQKMEAKKAEKAEAKATAPTIDLSPIEEMFAAAIANGYKKPTYRAEGLRIKPGKGGALYVLTEDRMEMGTYGEQPGYEGKILDRKFLPVRAANPATQGKLEYIAKDPLAAAIAYGQRTGTCSCCGRKLTNHTSIDLGIGPICREKWGL